MPLRESDGQLRIVYKTGVEQYTTKWLPSWWKKRCTSCKNGDGFDLRRSNWDIRLTLKELAAIEKEALDLAIRKVAA
jgi:hypothetical protein